MDGTSRRQDRAPYQSPLREEQAQRTGERILEALATHLAEQGWETFSIARVAARAGVSEPTVYRHFPNREAMLAALTTWIEQRVAFPATPTSIEDLPVLAHALFDHFQANAPLVRAHLHSGVGREVHESGQRGRDRRVLAMGAAGFDHLPPDEARAVAAMIRVMLSSESWDTMTGRLGVDPAAASAAVSWAAQILVEAAQRDRKRGRRTLVGPERVAAANALREQARARRDGKKGP
jgi:AcrR family transcriptional regulator